MPDPRAKASEDFANILAEVRDRLVDEILSLGRRCQVYASDIKSLQSASPERIWCVILENNQGVILPAPD